VYASIKINKFPEEKNMEEKSYESPEERFPERKQRWKLAGRKEVRPLGPEDWESIPCGNIDSVAFSPESFGRK
jgi:hypothetical protein